MRIQGPGTFVLVPNLRIDLLNEGLSQTARFHACTYICAESFNASKDGA